MGLLDSIFGFPYRLGGGGQGGISAQQAAAAPITSPTTTTPTTSTPAADPVVDAWNEASSDMHGGAANGMLGSMGNFGQGLANTAMQWGQGLGNGLSGLLNSNIWNNQHQGDILRDTTFQTPVIPNYGMFFGNQMAQQNAAGPGQMVAEMNDAIGGQLNQNADNNFRNNVLQAIMGLGNNNGGNRMLGAADVNSRQFAALPGAGPGNMANYGTTITASAPTSGSVRASANNIASAGSGFKLPQAVPMSGKQYGQANQNFGNQLASATGNAGLDYARTAGPQAQRLGLDIASARANQGNALGNVAQTFNQQNVQNAVSRQGAMLAALSRMGKLA